MIYGDTMKYYIAIKKNVINLYLEIEKKKKSPDVEFKKSKSENKFYLFTYA